MSNDLSDFTAQIADSVDSFVLAVREVAAGESPEVAVPMLLLQVSQLLLAGGRLGAIADVVPDERFEPDTGFDPDVQAVRACLANVLEPIDDYVEVFDPCDRSPELVESRLSDDLANVLAELMHGLAHYRAGRWREALWWWQFSYLSHWGTLASAALRALQSVVLHARLADGHGPDGHGPDGHGPDGHDTDGSDGGGGADGVRRSQRLLVGSGVPPQQGVSAQPQPGRVGTARGAGPHPARR